MEDTQRDVPHDPEVGMNAMFPISPTAISAPILLGPWGDTEQPGGLCTPKGFVSQLRNPELRKPRAYETPIIFFFPISTNIGCLLWASFFCFKNWGHNEQKSSDLVKLTLQWDKTGVMNSNHGK